MGCSNCTNNNGKPNGCKSNGHCVSGGCDQMSVYNWLSNIEDVSNNQQAVEVSFKNGDQKLIALQIFAGPKSARKYDKWQRVTPKKKD